MDQYDVIIVGGQHAGCEAALVAARESKTLLLAENLDRVAQIKKDSPLDIKTSQNLLKELDHVGLAMPRAIKRSMNFQKTAPAIDETSYHVKMKSILEREMSLFLYQARVVGFLFRQNRGIGIETVLGERIGAKSIILCLSRSQLENHVRDKSLYDKKHELQKGTLPKKENEILCLSLARILKTAGMKIERKQKPGFGKSGNRKHALEFLIPRSMVSKNLESRRVENLFFAGSLLGIYDPVESAASGFAAGLFASMKINNKVTSEENESPFIEKIVRSVST